MASSFPRTLLFFLLLLLPFFSSSSGSSTDPCLLVEKRVLMPYLAVNGTTITELGHHAGYYPLPHSHAARMFYLFFESRTNKNHPIVIWLHGGPGCSSEVAVFYENGLFHVTSNLTLTWNVYGWDKVSNLLYIDQPTGTGFSYSSDSRDTRHDEEGVSNDLYDFLQGFFTQHPQFVKNDVYITGESYGGHYIPAFASRVHKGNKDKEGIHINLKGIAIGNGLTNSPVQYKAYPDYALHMGLIKKPDYDRITCQLIPACEQRLKICRRTGGHSCEYAYLECNDIFESIIEINPGLNYMDIRK